MNPRPLSSEACELSTSVTETLADLEATRAIPRPYDRATYSARLPCTAWTSPYELQLRSKMTETYHLSSANNSESLHLVGIGDYRTREQPSLTAPERRGSYTSSKHREVQEYSVFN